MTHVMVPDGVLPWWLSASGWVLASLLIGIALWRLRGITAGRMVPVVAVMTALMVAIMSVELVPIGYELHLTVLSGMMLGPWYGAIAAVLFNVLRATIGDGAFTNIGLNTTITWTEIALGAALFAAIRPLAGRRFVAAAAGAITFVSLFAATIVFIACIGLSTINPAAAIHTGMFDVQAGAFNGSPMAEGLVSVNLTEEHEEAGHDAAEPLGMAPFTLWLLALGAIGWIVEAIITGAMVAFIARVRPELLGLQVYAQIPSPDR